MVSWARAGIAVAAAVAALGAAAGLWWAGHDASSRLLSTEGGGEHWVTIAGPEGEVWNGTVTAPGSQAVSVLAALHLAAAAGGFEVALEEYAGFGACGTYVRAIGGIAATRSDGWLYYVRSAGAEDWSWGDRGAACYALLDGDAVRWTWSA